MISTLGGRTALAAVMAALFAAGLDHMSSAYSAVVSASGSEAADTVRVRGEASVRLDPLETRDGRPDAQVIRGLVGPSGGAMDVLGHSLEVPAGVVVNPTLFTMVVPPGTAVQVELTAIGVASGVDMGARGFHDPVRLALSYEGAEGVAPDRLVLGRVEPDGSTTPIPSSVDVETRTVWADLHQFSRYTLFTR
jgi:hypothetical protein